MRVLLSAPDGFAHWIRQTPNGDGVWGDMALVYNEVSPDPDRPQPDWPQPDWLVVYDEPHPALTTRLPVDRRILFIGEPPDLKSYPARYLNQFGIVVSPSPLPGYTGRRVAQHSALPWHYGIDMAAFNTPGAAMGWADLMRDKPKSKTLSVICSNKAVSVQHRRRLAFVERLERRLGSAVDVFGRGFTQIADKADAIAPYRYHIVLENNVTDDFWTEKLADAWLGDSYALFSGCRTIARDFDASALTQIDIAAPDTAIDAIERVLATDPWASSRDAIRTNRLRLMTEHNIAAVIEKLTRSATARDAAPLILPAAVPIAPSRRAGPANTARRAMVFATRQATRLLKG
jgi:hypothetical protein